jgi:hypothetical protein
LSLCVNLLSSILWQVVINNCQFCSGVHLIGINFFFFLKGDTFYYYFFLITDFIALIAVNNLLDIQLLPSIPSC